MSLRQRLLQCFGRWIGRGAAVVAAPQPVPSGRRREAEDFAQLNRLAPRKDAPDTHNAFVRREAILSRGGRIAGYEFSLLTSMQARMNQEQELTRQAYDAALLTRMALQGVQSLLGRRLAFIQVAVESLSNLRISQLPPKNTVLVVHLGAHTTELESLPARFARLKEEGFLVGLMADEDFDMAGPLLEQVDFIQINVTAFNGIDLRTATRALRAVARPGGRALRLVARNVQSYDDYQFCSKCGFDFFQGAFISSRESLRPSSAKINRMVLLPILNMVMSDRSFGEIADQLSSEPTMSYKLLRYLNSAAMGLQKPIDNLTEALVLIGREKFYRWTSLLLFDFAEPDYQQRLLAERALTRGRTLELMAGKGLIPEDAGKLFLVGLFSLLDEALGRSLPELLAQAALPEAVRDALLGKPGPYADALNLVVLGEANSSTRLVQIAEAVQRCGIDYTDFMPAAAQALVWANQMLAGEETEAAGGDLL
ncbi:MULTISPECIES: EAL and HDOD domain-containing protein [unclassified Uliginosibacterium]|uniref:EAL and HDOD domain-containing protein n=1 Tax=unclassified Uliginosibacterium TaxID=2621521 RepID=UPI000C7E06F8|nr:MULTISPECIES: HDOD domain-containing protein [unclassified Uliginosibacterium]MDO6387882.1 HDOD domain-containing protein [Uliginosibacterium sp. 31-12]PLK50122.1 hypothetical protein C0V76_06865 [Uliginosibacterium sp. TH139]